MRCWIDTDVGDDPDDLVALACAAAHPGLDVAGVSTVGRDAGDAARRAGLARAVLPAVPVVAGPPPPERVAAADALVLIGPWTHGAALAAAGALPGRVAAMGGAFGPVHHRGAVVEVEHNVGADPPSASALVRAAAGVDLLVVPLDVTASLRCSDAEEAALTARVPGLRDALDRWRSRRGPVPFVLHDPAALLACAGEPCVWAEPATVVVDAAGRMRRDPSGSPVRVVVGADRDRLVARVRALVG